RLFQISRNARWSDGKQVTAPDVLHTVSLLCDANWKGRDPEWAFLMKQGEAARIESDGMHISMTLEQGILDPLSLLDFKILPEHLLRAVNNPDFAKKPTGSGPYLYEGPNGSERVFAANPYYETRPGKQGLPAIREIRLRESRNPADDFRVSPPLLHVLLDVPH